MDIATSVIILSYNKFEDTTGPCLESLFANGDDQYFEIIVVDNNSTDGSAEMLEKLVRNHPDVKLVLNKENRGFPGGNNDGARIASGRILILLNSDTIVPAGELMKLSTLMHLNQDWAMLGPVTNQAGNEQKIFTEGEKIDHILREGAQWCEHSRNDAYPSERLDFFCVAIRESIYTELGGLDERFGLGYYEDTDFSLQVKKAGHKMMFTENAFIYHQAGKSFSSEGLKRIKRLMRANRRRLSQKHSGRIKLLHMRQCNVNILRQYIEAKKSGPPGDDDLRYKFNNRMCLAREMYPNNPLKKWRYAALLRHLERNFRHA